MGAVSYKPITNRCFLSIYHLTLENLKVSDVSWGEREDIPKGIEWEHRPKKG